MSDAIFPKKWDKRLPESFKNTAESMGDEELKRKIVEFEQAIDEHEQDMENDTKLNALKEEMKTTAGTYKEPIVECQAQIRYACWILRNRGKA
jgi:hypothetical protein